MSKVMNGDYSAVYFNRAANIAAKTGREVTMQFFQRKEDTVLAGMSTVLTILDTLDDRLSITVKSLDDGHVAQPWEPVLTIQGAYHIFAHLESPLLGLLARGSRIATNTRRVSVDSLIAAQVKRSPKK